MKRKDHHLMERNGMYYLQANGIKKSLRTRDKEEAKRAYSALLTPSNTRAFLEQITPQKPISSSQIRIMVVMF
jgi:hypothetical protein